MQNVQLISALISWTCTAFSAFLAENQRFESSGPERDRAVGLVCACAEQLFSRLVAVLVPLALGSLVFACIVPKCLCVPGFKGGMHPCSLDPHAPSPAHVAQHPAMSCLACSRPRPLYMTSSTSTECSCAGTSLTIAYCAIVGSLAQEIRRVCACGCGGLAFELQRGRGAVPPRGLRAELQPARVRRHRPGHVPALCEPGRRCASQLISSQHWMV